MSYIVDIHVRQNRLWLLAMFAPLTQFIKEAALRHFLGSQRDHSIEFLSTALRYDSGMSAFL